MIVVDVALMRRTINKEPNMAENITSSLRVEDTDGERLAATVETKNGKVDIYIGETDGEAYIRIESPDAALEGEMPGLYYVVGGAR
jgi:hypothetical protein